MELPQLEHVRLRRCDSAGELTLCREHAKTIHKSHLAARFLLICECDICRPYVHTECNTHDMRVKIDYLVEGNNFTTSRYI